MSEYFNMDVKAGTISARECITLSVRHVQSDSACLCTRVNVEMRIYIGNI